MPMTASERPIRSAISQLAADWFAAHRRGPLSPGEREEFLGWLKASPIHIEEYLGVAALEPVLRDAARDPPLSIAALRELARSDDDATVVDLVAASPGTGMAPASSAGPVPLRNVRLLWLATAALVVLSLGGLYIFRQSTAEHRPVSKTYVTARGQRETWQLSDGSTIHLDTDTAVTVRLSATERLVQLDRGQIAVTVRHDPGRPFHVRAGAADAVAVGTQFDVYRIADTTTVTVLAGLVAVSVPDAAKRTLRVGVGQKVSIVEGLLPLAASPANAREASAWLEGKIAFERRPLGEVAAEFNRYNAVQFSIDDAELRAMPISGKFDAADVDSFADFLGSLDGVRLQRSGTRVEVLRIPSAPRPARSPRPH
jgi:transmembrane sensor